MRVESKFKPHWLVANRHVQTLLGPMRAKTLHTPKRWQELSFPDGDFCEVAWFNESSAPNNPILIILHGLEGSFRSHYVQRLLTPALAKDWLVAVIHFKGCGEKDNHFTHSYHSGATEHLDVVLSSLSTENIQRPVYTVGFSLGGNVLLKWLAENSQQSIINKAMAVSSPLKLNACADAIKKGFSRVYQKHLIDLLKTKAQLKLEQNKQGPQIDRSLKWHLIKDFWAFDNAVTAPLNGFNDVHDYYASASSFPLLTRIKTPTLILHAHDDPFMDDRVIPNSSQLSGAITYELSHQGGHVGFIENLSFQQNGCFLSRRMIEFFSD